MSQGLQEHVDRFVDRRSYDIAGRSPLHERRQFTNSYDELSPEATELAQAIDGYKISHRRRFITYEEMLARAQNVMFETGSPVPMLGKQVLRDGKTGAAYVDQTAFGAALGPGALAPALDRCGGLAARYSK